jgi:hypothetical protein
MAGGWMSDAVRGRLTASLVVGVLLLSAVLVARPGAGAAGTWTGIWQTDLGVMELSQSGSRVHGTFGTDQGRIVGMVKGAVLSGTWVDAPTFKAPDDGGAAHLTMSADGQSFTGRRRHGSKGAWSPWTGTRVEAAGKPSAQPSPELSAEPSPELSAEPSLVPSSVPSPDTAPPAPWPVVTAAPSSLVTAAPSPVATAIPGAPVEVPDVRGMDEAAAVGTLSGRGLVAAVVDISGIVVLPEGTPIGAVYLTRPEAGASVPPGTTVHVYVPRGADQSPGPSPEPSQAPAGVPSPEPTPSPEASTAADWAPPAHGVDAFEGTGTISNPQADGTVCSNTGRAWLQVAPSGAALLEIETTGTIMYGGPDPNAPECILDDTEDRFGWEVRGTLESGAVSFDSCNGTAADGHATIEGSRVDASVSCTDLEARLSAHLTRTVTPSRQWPLE